MHHTELADGTYGAPLAFAVRTMTLDFKAPARIDDVLEVETCLTYLTAARLGLDQVVLRDEQVLVRAKVEAVVISPDGRPRRLQKPALALLQAHATDPEDAPA